MTKRLASAVALLSASVLALCLLLAPPARALTVTGPATVQNWNGCGVPLQYSASGAVGAVTWRIESPYNSMTIDGNGRTNSAFSSFDRSQPIVVHATDASGATASFTTTANARSWFFNLPPAAPDMRCDPSIFRTYWAYDSGATDSFNLTETYDSYGVSYPDFGYKTLPYSEDVAVWIKQSHYGSPTLRSVVTVPKSLWTAVSFGSYDNIGKGPAGLPAPTGTPWNPLSPWAGVTASYDSVYPYPTPDRVLADGGSDDNGSAAVIDLWPRGVEYGGVCCGANDYHQVNMLVRQYKNGFIWPNCINGSNGANTPGPYFYCVGADYDASCFNHAVMSDCGGYDGQDEVSPYAQPSATFDLAGAWRPTPYAGSGSDPAAPPVGKVFAAPTSAQIAAIRSLFLSQGIDLSSFPSVPMRVISRCDANYDCSDRHPNKQVIWELDGRNTFFCDHAAWQSSRLLAAAPYLLNGVYCADTDSSGRNPAPSAALGEGGAPGTPTGGGCGVGSAADL